MTVDVELETRLEDYFSQHPTAYMKKMFGGVCYMIDGHMCCGIAKGQSMVRVGQNNYPELLKREHASEMDFTGKPMKGFLFVAAEGVASSDQLKSWLTIAEEFVHTLPPKPAK